MRFEAKIGKVFARFKRGTGAVENDAWRSGEGGLGTAGESRLIICEQWVSAPAFALRLVFFAVFPRVACRLLYWRYT